MEIFDEKLGSTIIENDDKLCPVSLKEYLENIKTQLSEDIIKSGMEINAEDYEWRHKLRKVIMRITTIMSHPRLHIKTERDVVLAEIASKVDSIGMNMTYRDARLWKMADDGKMIPERVYATLYEDEIAIYENKFISLLLDIVYTYLTLEISYLYTKVGQLNKLVANKQLNLSHMSSIAMHSEFRYAVNSLNRQTWDKDIPVDSYLTTPGSDIAAVINDLMDLRSRVVRCFENRFYRICKKSGKMSVTDVNPTNILTQDPDYNFCYLYFKDLQTVRRKATMLWKKEEEKYPNFIVRRVINELVQMGFKPEDENKIINVSNKGFYIFNNVKFTKEFITATVTGNDGEKIKLDVEILEEQNQLKKNLDTESERNRKASFLLELYPFRRTIDIPIEQLNKVLADKISQRIREGYDNCFIITDRTEIQINNAILCSPSTARLDVTLENMMKSFFIFVSGDSYIYSKHCPICGSIGVDYEDGEYNCTMCNSLYSILRFDNGDDENGKLRETMWLKRVIRPLND